jgi:hypothetical protein
MIAEYQVHATAVTLRLFLEPHDEIHDITGFGATIEEVAGEYEVRIAAAPGELVINNTGALQGSDEAIVGAVNVSNRYDSLDVREMPLFRIRKR